VEPKPIRERQSFQFLVKRQLQRGLHEPKMKSEVEAQKQSFFPLDCGSLLPLWYRQPAANSEAMKVGRV
jgi:hypothetical protein